MEKIRGLRDVVTKSSDKKCCIKVAVGVAVGVVLLIVIIVAAVLSTSSETNEPVSNIDQTTNTDAPTIAKLQGLDIAHQFLLRMGSLENPTFHEILAIEDNYKAYIMQIDETFKNVYVIVNFQRKTQVFVGMRKEHDAGSVKETTMLFCHESKFASDFTGSYLSSSELKTGDHSVPSNGRTTDLTIDDVGAVYKASPFIASVINGSCSNIPSNTMLKWKEKASECTVTTKIDTNNTSTCSLTCPKCKDLAQTEKQSCNKFDQCNYDMGNCDPYWKSEISYNGQPYCICRQTLASDMRRISCPKSAADGGDCEVPRRTIVDFENNNPCFCRYRIPIIHPYIQATGGGLTMFTLQSVIVTAPARSHEECDR